MPAIAPTCRAHWPAQFTTFSQSDLALRWSRTATIRSPSIRKPVTRTPSTSVAPCIRAPLASERAMSDGLACPSVGSQLAPMRSEVSMSGHIRFTSSGGIRCISIPKLRAVVARRRNSVQRSGVVASRRQPVIFQPVSSPVSSASRL